MSTFTVPVKRIRAIEPHPNADAIEFAVIDGYRSIVRKGQFAAGDPVVYLPEQALLPKWMLEQLGFWDEANSKGRLNGRDGNRIKAVKLRGEISQGIIWPASNCKGSDGILVAGDGCFFDKQVREEDNVAEMLGVVKWEPEIPAAMSGEVWNAGSDFTVNFDVENIKSFPDILIKGEEIIITEKLHGTFTGITVLPLDMVAGLKEPGFGKHGNILIWSKGLGAKGLVFKNSERNANNLYVRSTKKLVEALDAAHEEDNMPYDYPEGDEAIPYIAMGETFGKGVQDLGYTGVIEFRVFALLNKSPTIGDYYLGQKGIFDWLGEINVAVSTVPVLYKGPYSPEIVAEHTNGKSTLGDHIREGVVVTTVNERRDPRIGRVILKSVSDAYLTRKGGTEFN